MDVLPNQLSQSQSEDPEPECYILFMARRTSPNGPDQLVPYRLVRVASRLAPHGVVGTLLLEPLIPCAAYLSTDGTYGVKDLPSEEVRNAVQEADDALASEMPTKSSWIGGIVGAFESHWEPMTVIESAVYEVPAGGDADDVRMSVLRRALEPT